MNSLDSSLRNLAKSSYWQNIYNSSKTCSGVTIFNNINNFSGIQSRFLYWLSTYDMIYTELSTYEDELLTQDVIDDEYRMDAYLIHRSKKCKYLWKKHRKEERASQLKANRKKGFKNPGKESQIKIDLRKEQ